jgi:hypothetical protein
MGLFEQQLKWYRTNIRHFNLDQRINDRAHYLAYLKINSLTIGQ